MIGSFWSLCRACPSMPVDKLHSEYRSTYRWHEYTGPRQEVVRRAPQGGQGQANAMPPNEERRIEFSTQSQRIDEESHEMPKLEPAMPRRKKYPDLAYRHHEFIPGETATRHHDAADNASADRARSEERGVSHWRPSRRSKSEGRPARNNQQLTSAERRRDSDPDVAKDTEDTGRDSGLLKKAISKISTEYRLQFAWPQGHTSRRDAADAQPRKSQSMGALKPAANAMIHRKRNDCEPRDGNASELEPLVNESNTIKEEEYNKPEAVYNKDFKPYARGAQKHDVAHVVEEATKHLLQNGDATAPKSEWIRECVELRKKAGEYKNRGWGSKLAPEADIYNKQVELWDQVSRRSSLSALSLASTAHRNYTKEEKDHENTKKSSPTKALRNAENSKLMKDMIRHHLERTTGGTEFDGLILSPTREKLEPTIPKRDDDSRGSQKNSPKKGSPQKTALQKKNSLKSKSALKTARSQSVGPSDMTSTEKRSPKRQSRSAVVQPPATRDKKAPSPAAPPSVAVNGVATPTNMTNNIPAVKRPRPSSLNTTTTASSRSKSSSVPSRHEDERLVKSKSNKNSSNETNAHARNKRRGRSASEKTDKQAPEVSEPDPIDLEPVVKSPPEPTRVKSPEQIMIRSPDPVNWTVPLDTGKTFTVTQNVREGDLAARPHSEVKAWTPPDMPPPIAQSAPPQLPEQPCKEPAGRLAVPVRVHSPVDESAEDEEVVVIAVPSCSSSTTMAGDVLQMARNRFDAFWGRSNSDEV